MISYGFTKELDVPYETVIKLAREALKKEGFGILTEIDLKKTQDRSYWQGHEPGKKTWIIR